MKRILAPILAVTMLSTMVLAQPVLAGGNEIDVIAEVVVKVDVDGGRTAEDVAAEDGGFVLESLIPSRGIYRLGITAAVDEEKVAKKTDDAAKDFAKDLEKQDGVVWAEPKVLEDLEDTRFHAWPDSTYGETVELDLQDQPVWDYLELDEAHGVATGAGVVVAVLDTGVDAAHPFLSGRVLAGYDLVDDDQNPAENGNGLDDDGDGLIDEAFGHGTFVAGVVLQIAPDATILPIRVLDADGRADVHAVAEGIDMAIEMGAKVINLSSSLRTNDKPDLLKDALKRAKDADVLVIAAAGNTGADEKLYPGSESSVVSVGSFSLDDLDEVTGFSSHGGWVVLAAPGVGIVSSLPGGGYAEWAGTSMSAPIVAGEAALLAQLDPGAKRNDLEKALKDGAVKMNGKKKTEKGRIDILLSLAEL